MPSLLPLLALLLSGGAPSPDPCGVAGVYDLDRDPIHAEIVASMDDSTAELGDRPAGDLARIEWDARKAAYADVRAQALAGKIVPAMDLDLEDDGTFTFRVEDRHDADETQSTTVGQWQVDAACREIVLEAEDEDPMVGEIEGDRITLSRTNPAGINTLSGLELERRR